MSLPDVTLTLVDGQLGIASENIDGIHVTLGVCSAGTPNTLYGFGSPSSVGEQLGRGPLVEALAYKLDNAGGPQYAMPVTPSVPGTHSVVTPAGAGAPAVTLTGAPVDDFEGRVRIVLGGTLGNGTFQYSVDGGDAWSETITLAATYAISETGTVINFAAGTYTPAHSYLWTSEAPFYSLSDLAAAFTALLTDPRKWRFVHVMGSGANAAATAALAASVQAQMEAARARYRYVSAIVEAAEDTDGALIAALAPVAANRVLAVPAKGELISRLTGRIYRRHQAWGVAMRAASVGRRPSVGIATHLGRVAVGPVPGWTKLYRDEAESPALDGQRFTTMRTIVGKPGFYISRGVTLAPFGSDFSAWENLQVINKACTIVRDVMVEQLNGELELTGAGTLSEGDAQRIEELCLSALSSQMVAFKNCTAAFARVNRAVNIASTRKLLVSVRVRPLGYAEDIGVDIGFEAPRAAA